jgi:hypothetical protein
MLQIWQRGVHLVEFLGRMFATVNKRAGVRILRKRITYTVIAFFLSAMFLYESAEYLSFRMGGLFGVDESPVRQWKKIYAGVDGDQLFVDESNIVRIGSAIEYSEWIVWREPRTFPGVEQVASVESRLFVDCA